MEKTKFKHLWQTCFSEKYFFYTGSRRGSRRNRLNGLLPSVQIIYLKINQKTIKWSYKSSRFTVYSSFRIYVHQVRGGKKEKILKAESNLKIQ